MNGKHIFFHLTLLKKNVEEAINFINDREKPLALYIFSHNNKVRLYREQFTLRNQISLLL